jgi:hypothetical protein
VVYVVQTACRSCPSIQVRYWDSVVSDIGYTDSHVLSELYKCGIHVRSGRKRRKAMSLPLWMRPFINVNTLAKLMIKVLLWSAVSGISLSKLMRLGVAWLV